MQQERGFAKFFEISETHVDKVKDPSVKNLYLH